MTFKDQHGNWSDILSTSLGTCSAFIIMVGIFWLVLTPALSGDIIIMPMNPLLRFILLVQGPFILLLIGSMCAILSWKIGKVKKEKTRREIVEFEAD